MTDLELAREIFQELTAEHPEPVLPFTLEPGEPGVFDSKMGGTPYLPRDMAWPLDSQGSPLNLLAQIDCAALSGLPDFPHSGLLQFFVGTDDLYGADFDDETTQKDFRILYHETADPSVTAAEVETRRPPAAGDEERYTPLGDRICFIRFGTPGGQGISGGDFRFEKWFLEKWNARRPAAPLKSRWELYGLLDDDELEAGLFGVTGGEHHQLGGYPFFIQTDPRSREENGDLDVLLFQLDTEMRDRRELVMWGDAGVGNFFIGREALKRRDFSRVMYNWDCG